MFTSAHKGRLPFIYVLDVATGIILIMLNDIYQITGENANGPLLRN